MGCCEGCVFVDRVQQSQEKSKQTRRSIFEKLDLDALDAKFEIYVSWDGLVQTKICVLNTQYSNLHPQGKKRKGNQQKKKKRTKKQIRRGGDE